MFNICEIGETTGTEHTETEHLIEKTKCSSTVHMSAVQCRKIRTGTKQT